MPYAFQKYNMGIWQEIELCAYALDDALPATEDERRRALRVLEEDCRAAAAAASEDERFKIAAVEHLLTTLLNYGVGEPEEVEPVTADMPF